VDKIRVVLIDDHELVRTGMEMLFNRVSNIDLLGSHASIENAFSDVTQADVLVTDAMLGSRDVLVELIQLKEWISTPKIVVITGQTDPDYITKLSDLNIGGLVSKASDPDCLVEAVEAVNRDERYQCPEVAKIVSGRSAKSEHIANLFALLSERERQIAMRSAKGERPTDIATQLQLSVKTVNTYRYRTYKKLGCTNDVELSRIFHEAGLLSD